MTIEERERECAREILNVLHGSRMIGQSRVREREVPKVVAILAECGAFRSPSAAALRHTSELLEDALSNWGSGGQHLVAWMDARSAEVEQATVEATIALREANPSTPIPAQRSDLGPSEGPNPSAPSVSPEAERLALMVDGLALDREETSAGLRQSREPEMAAVHAKQAADWRRIAEIVRSTSGAVK